VTLDFAPADAHLAPAFALRLVRGVKNGPSPEWMQKRLRAIGLRPINALVDITNYVTFDRARPLHVFDARKVAGDLVVRRAKAGEELLALDGRTYALDESNVVIADANGVESIAGVMGGEHSGCDEATTDVLIESALWDPLDIATTGRKLGIVTDARYRFERGVDPAFCIPGCELATHLVMDLCGGEPSAMIVAGKVPVPDHRVEFPWSETKRLTGLDLPAAEQAKTLERLGFEILSQDSTRAVVRAPGWRPDIEGKADLTEEVARIAGFDAIRPAPFEREEKTVATPVLTLLQKRTRGARRALAARGLVEAVTWSFISHEAATLFGGGAGALVLANPIAAELSDMRPSLAPGLLAAAQRNADRGFGDAALFEVGQIFLGDGEGDQHMAAAAIRRGAARAQGPGRHWRERSGAVDVFDAKADAFALLAALGVSASAVQIVPGGPSFLHPGRSATLQFGPKNVAGWFGELHPRALGALDVEGPLAGFEIILDALPAPKARPTRIRPKLDLTGLMPLDRDFAFVVDHGVRAADIVKAAQGAERALIAGVQVFDVYVGPGIPEGKKSVAVAVTLQPRERTLTDADIEATSQKIVAEVAKKTGASLRG
jgi:phenylalanyl-tRNA synthetase beta chain